MNLEQIIDEIKLIVQDESFFTSDASIIYRVNDAVSYACNRAWTDIPSLRTMSSFTTDVGQAYAELSGVDASFSGKVIRVGKPGTRLYSSLEDLYDDYYPLDKVGEVEAVCIQNNVIWYQGIPAEATTLHCILQEDPPLLVNSDDVPYVIPEFLHMDVIVHGVVARLYNMLEDGVNEEKVNTSNSTLHHEKGLQMFKEWLGSRRQHVKSSHWKY